jgi:peroxiredoxin
MSMRFSRILVLGLLLTTAAFLAVPASPAVAEEPDPAEARLLPVGKEAPDFTLPGLDGGEIALTNLQKLGKAILLIFWTTEPKRGADELPKLQKLHDELGPKGLAIVAINPEDSKSDIKDLVEEKKLTLPIALDGKETNSAVTGVYRARKLPTLYVLDKDSKVQWRSIGLKEASLRETLTKLGVK